MTVTNQPIPLDIESTETGSQQLQRELDDCQRERKTALTQLFELRIESDSQIAALHKNLRDIEDQLGLERAARNADLLPLRDVIAEHENAIAERENAIAEREHRIAVINQAIADRDAEIAAIGQTVADRDAEIAAIRQTVADRDAEIAAIRQIIAERDAKITDVTHVLGCRDMQIRSMTQTITSLESRIAELDRNLASRDAYIGLLLSSTSWRLTAPMRFLKRWWPRIRSGIAQWLHALYLVMPLPMRLKTQVKGLIFAVFSPLLKNTRSYQAWVEFEQKRKEGTTRPFTAESTNPPEIAAAAPSQVLPRSADPGSEDTALTHSLHAGSGGTEARGYALDSNTETAEIPPATLDDSPYRAAYQQKFMAASIKETDGYVAIDEKGPELPPDKPKVIAFYLPQFHPIPLNDVAWGKGFTEWTNVSKAVPQYLGHYQPHLPGELGFYDLRVSDVRSRQVELAKLYGIHGFCFHYYWFSGSRLLEKPLDDFIADSSLDFPFCLCWANENWTRRWDGQEHEVLIAQDHSPESDLSFIEEVAPILADPRYIRVNGKPLLIVYRPQLFPDPSATTTRWREYCERTGLGGIHLVAAQTFGLTDPRPYGFDAAVEFPPHNTPALELTEQLTLLNPDYAGHIYDYRDLVARKLASYRREPYPVYRCVFPGWDNEARRPGSGHVFHNAEPRMYGRWLNGAFLSTQLHSGNPDERLVFINAWNEWAEGAHLEPDRRYGYAYLDTTKKILKRFAQTRKKRPRIAVVLHLFYADLWPEIRAHLYNLPEVFDLFITVDKNLAAAIREEIWRDFPQTRFKVFENRGRDILPFFKLLAGDELKKYDLACKIHTKKSVHGDYGEMWRQELLDRLMASPDSIMQIAELFEKDKKMAMVGADEHVLQSTYYWGVSEEAESNRRHVKALAQRMGFVDYSDHFYFVAGSMFWFRPKLLAQLSSLNLGDDDFEPEQGQKDGTMAHGLERFLGLYARQRGWHLADTKGSMYLDVTETSRPKDASEVWNSFAHPTYDGAPL